MSHMCDERKLNESSIALTDNAMTDDSLVTFLGENMDLYSVLADIIPAGGHRIKFVKAFKTPQVNSAGGAAGQVRQIVMIFPNSMQSLGGIVLVVLFVHSKLDIT